MRKQSGGTTEMLGLHAAVQRFPSQAGKIQDLLASDEAFQGMCDDLATAEQVLSAVDQLPAGIRIERRLEYERLVEELANEIENALHRSNIIPISRPQRP